MLKRVLASWSYVNRVTGSVVYKKWERNDQRFSKIERKGKEKTHSTRKSQYKQCLTLTKAPFRKRETNWYGTLISFCSMKKGGKAYIQVRREKKKIALAASSSIWMKDEQTIRMNTNQGGRDRYHSAIIRRKNNIHVRRFWSDDLRVRSVFGVQVDLDYRAWIH